MANNSFTAYGDQVTTNKLTLEVRQEAQPTKAFSQAATPPTGESMGLREGDTGQYTFAPDVDTEGGQIPEGDRIPATGLTPVKATFVLVEFANSVDYTGKLRDLSNIDIEDVHIGALLNDYQKAINTAAFVEFDKTDWLVVITTAASTREFSKTGSVSTTQDTDLTLDTLGFVRTQAENENIPFWDGESYLVLAAPDTVENLASDSTLATLLSRDSGRDALNNEFGRVKECRLVKDNHKLVTNNSAGFKPFYLVGNDAVVNEVAQPVEIRFQDDDFERSLAIAWYLIASWFKVLDETLHGREHIIKSVTQ